LRKDQLRDAIQAIISFYLAERQMLLVNLKLVLEVAINNSEPVLSSMLSKMVAQG
jgi:hypothetical protein